MEITFLGATETVTGSKYLITYDDRQQILVDCGLFQGLKESRHKNWQPMPFDVHRLHAVILTHAHIDHTGYLPVLVKNGFTGKIYCTQGTYDLCKILLPDSGYLQEEEAAYANLRGYSKHQPALPLYTLEDAENCLTQFSPEPYNKTISLSSGLTFQLIYSSHIIGASFVQINYKNKSLVFSGDLGRPHDPLLHPPQFIKEADYLVLESTYGDRLHEKEDPKKLLQEIINTTLKRGGTVVIPAFAVGRTQTLLHYLTQLKKEKCIPDVRVFLDSPMATNCTNLLQKHQQSLTISNEEINELNNATIFIKNVEESKALDMDFSPKIIVSASGMAEGGRVLHHIKTFAPDARNTILFTGFQTPGTRGEKILTGATEIKLLGEIVPIKAEVKSMLNTSAHADYEEILMWLQHFNKLPKKIFLTHGEQHAAIALKEKIEKRFKCQCVIPHYGYKERL